MPCRDHVIGPYLLTRDAHQQECLLHFLHDQPAGEHVETEQVQRARAARRRPRAAARPAARLAARMVLAQ